MLLKDFFNLYYSRRNDAPVIDDKGKTVPLFDVLCNEHNLSIKKLRNEIKRLKFAFNQSTKTYIFKGPGEEEEALNIDITERCKPGKTPEKHTAGATDAHEKQTENIYKVPVGASLELDDAYKKRIFEALDKNEKIYSLQQSATKHLEEMNQRDGEQLIYFKHLLDMNALMVTKMDELKEVLKREEKPQTIRQRIANMAGGKRTRNTLTIREEEADRLQAYADETGLHKSDIVTAALAVLFEKIEEEKNNQ